MFVTWSCPWLAESLALRPLGIGTVLCFSSYPSSSPHQPSERFEVLGRDRGIRPARQVVPAAESNPMLNSPFFDGICHVGVNFLFENPSEIGFIFTYSIGAAVKIGDRKENNWSVKSNFYGSCMRPLPVDNSGDVIFAVDEDMAAFVVRMFEVEPSVAFLGLSQNLRNHIQKKTMNRVRIDGSLCVDLFAEY